MCYGMNHHVYQREHDLETGNLNVHNFLAMVDLGNGHLTALFISLARCVADMADETTLECAGKNGFLIADKDLHAFVFQAIDDTRAQIYNLLVDVIEHGHTFIDVMLFLCAEEIQQQALGLFCGENLELMRVFNVHNLITDVIRCLNQIDQRIAHITIRTFGGFQWNYAQFVCNAVKDIHIITEKAELVLALRKVGRVRIFYYACQRTVSHDKTTGAATQEVMCKKTERIGISLKIDQVAPLLWCQSVSGFRANVITQIQSFSFAEICTNCPFSTMSERRVSQIMSQTGRTDNTSKF